MPEYYNEIEDQRRDKYPFAPQHGSGSGGAFDNRGVLVGPHGPTGLVGPQEKPNESAVLVGPSGPTGIIGPAQQSDGLGSPTAQRGVYFGQSGFGAYGRRPVLVGPGGPTGIIGPGRGGRPVLVGPGGPTGIIGPGYGRQPGVLVGPGGPTGQIGPQGFYGK